MYVCSIILDVSIVIWIPFKNYPIMAIIKVYTICSHKSGFPQRNFHFHIYENVQSQFLCIIASFPFIWNCLFIFVQIKIGSDYRLMEWTLWSKKNKRKMKYICNTRILRREIFHQFPFLLTPCTYDPAVKSAIKMICHRVLLPDILHHFESEWGESRTRKCCQQV